MLIWSRKGRAAAGALAVTIFSLTDRGNIADGSALTIVLVGVTLLLMMKLERIARRLCQR